MAEFLLEIGHEEMPASWLPGLTEQLRQRFVDLASREHLQPSSAVAVSTPRRLVVGARVLDRQADREERLWGPSLKVARDASGNWTGAAQGFARKNGVRAEDLQLASKDPASPDERHLLHVKSIPGHEARDVLPGIILSLLRALSFPKRMSWDAWLDDGKGTFPFGRPIRWMVALLDAEVLPVTIHAAAGGGKGPAIVAAGGHTFGHRFLPAGKAGRPIAVQSLADLRSRLREAFVVLDPAERETRIREAVARHGAADSAHAAELVSEWRDLVEYPTVVTGRIPAEFHGLPVEVLETVLVHHQKYIPVAVEGRVGRFAALTNTDASAQEAIVRGMERVVVARLRDAAFFFAEDMKRPLPDRVPDLAGITFHQGLGTYKDKTERMVRLVSKMGAQMGLLTKPEYEAAQEAASLAKADLTTAMVREFPELQGIMGGIYLRAQGHPWASVADAVRWHYHPVSIEEGSVPARALGAGDPTVFGAVSLADKLDTLAGYFGLGLNPTGSSDPFGLRRAAQGTIRVLLDFWRADDAEKRPSLNELVRAAVAGYEDRLKRPPDEVARDVCGFLLERLEFVLVSRGFQADEVDAVLYTPGLDALDNPFDGLKRLRALHKVRLEATEDFDHLAVAFKRAKNILTQQPAAPAIRPDLFEADAERELHQAVASAQGANGSYESRLRSLSRLRGPVDRFFDDVLVMAEDPKVRANRLGLLSQALSLFYRIADISKLGG